MINVLSLFDGMSCGQIALERAGIKVNKYFASEIKPHAIKVTQANYPDTIQLGDVQFITKDTLGANKIDLLIGGSPCQDFSAANLVQSGLQGEKSSLFYEYLRLLKELKPRYFLLENVKMKQEYQDALSEMLGVEPILIDSYVVSGVYRKRNYWTNIQGIGELVDRGVRLPDILDSGYTDREFGMCLLESLSRPLRNPVKIARRYIKYGFWQVIFKSEEHYKACKYHMHRNFDGLNAKEVEQHIIDRNIDVSVYDGVRYLSQSEMEKAQTVPEGYTSMVTRDQAASLLGDGWTVDVVAHLLQNMNDL
jgi:DNA (cytosine-5)-methyltransferase 3A